MFQGIDKKAVARWLVIRIAALPLIFVVVSFMSFFIVYGPGRSEPRLLDATDEQRALMRHEICLDRQWFGCYGEWLADAGRGDLGEFRLTQVSVRHQLSKRSGDSAELVGLALLFAAIAGLVLASGRCRFQNTSVGFILGLVTCVLDALPVFLVATIMLIVPSEKWGYTPPLNGAASLLDEPWNHVRQFVPAALIMAGPAVGTVARRCVRSDSEAASLPGAIRALPYALPLVIAGLIVVDLQFNINSLGSLFISALYRLELPMVHALVTLALFVGVGSFLFIDPVTPRLTHVTHPRGVPAPWLFVVGLVVVLIFTLAAVGPYIAPHDAADIGVGAPLENPSFDHWFGTDRQGRDMFSRSIEAFRPALRFGLSVTGVGFMLGTMVGILLAQSRVRIRAAMMQVAALATGISALPTVMAGIWLRDLDLSWAIGLAAFAAAFVGVHAGLVSGARLREPVHARVRRVLVPLASGGLEVLALSVLLHSTLGWFGFDPFLLPSPNWGQDVGTARNSFPFDYSGLLLPGLTLTIVLFALIALADALRAGYVESDDPSADSS